MKVRQIVPDWIKGIAIILMVYGHTNHVGSLAMLQKQCVQVIYTFHMPIFLIVSGFFFRVKDDVFSEFKVVFRRLIIPYIVFISLYLVGLTLIQTIGVHTSNLPPNSFMDSLNIIFIHPRGAYWFIHSLILIHLSFLVAKLFSIRFKLDDAMFFSVVIFLLAILCDYELIKLRTVFYFFIGTVFSKFTGKLPGSLGVAGCMIVALLVLAEPELFSFTFVQIAWCLSITALMAGIGNKLQNTLGVQIIAWFGRNTLIVLVLHAIFIVSMKPIGHKLLIVDETGVINSVVVLFITLTGCVFASFIFDRIKLSEYLFGVKFLYSKLFFSHITK
ncbi:MAG: acyltransferase family protein [Methylomonas sp.]|jgi:fucose 4-O-acetylase-like acetyltransferase|uniref:acyltransferase family protein n=1 Tax=Methylomonas sp. TaxID=418 RepID=UPI0025F8C5EC|nr:acyltransferase family protein [Methylomonas sp.]MCK9609087.1 acyltransferase family protein [Methylomonas sp.]